MVTVTDSVIINKPTELVFETIANPAHFLKWDRGSLKSVEHLDEQPLGKGSKFKIVEADAGAFNIELTAFIPDVLLRQHFKMKFGEGASTYKLEEVPEGTKLQMEISIQPKGLYGMFGSKIKEILTDRAHHSVSGIKQYLDAH